MSLAALYRMTSVSWPRQSVKTCIASVSRASWTFTLKQKCSVSRMISYKENSSNIHDKDSLISVSLLPAETFQVFTKCWCLRSIIISLSLWSAFTDKIQQSRSQQLLIIHHQWGLDYSDLQTAQVTRCWNCHILRFSLEPIWGHPFMTSTWRGRGSGQYGRMWMVGG